MKLYHICKRNVTEWDSPICFYIVKEQRGI